MKYELIVTLLILAMICPFQIVTTLILLVAAGVAALQAKETWQTRK